MDSSGADPVSRVQSAVGASLDRCGLIEAARPLVAAVSGGADSACLLDALVALLPHATDRLVVGHVDHKLRPESAEDAEHVRALAEGYGLRCEVLTVDVPTLVAAERRGTEEAARLGRYRALHHLSTATGATAVLTGHTRDDSVETVLLHLLRGSGHRGLGGIAEDETLDDLLNEDAAWERGHPGRPGPATTGAARMAALPGVRIIRPLLGVRRADTTAYCQARGITWLTDPTNADPRMLRNRVRAHLLPVLRTYNPAVDDALARLALVMRDEEALLQEIAEQRHRGLVREKDGRTDVDLAGWRTLPVALQRRLVRRIAREAGHDELGFDAVERALAVGQATGPLRAELGGGLTVERHRDRLRFESTGRGTT